MSELIKIFIISSLHAISGTDGKSFLHSSLEGNKDYEINQSLFSLRVFY